MRTTAFRWPLAIALVASNLATHAGPLSSAIKSGDASAARALLAEGAPANDADADGTTALHWAVHGGQAALVEALIAAGAKVDAVNRYGVPPLYVAA